VPRTLSAGGGIPRTAPLHAKVLFVVKPSAALRMNPSLTLAVAHPIDVRPVCELQRVEVAVACSNRHWWPVHSRNGRHCFVRTSLLLLRWWWCVFLGGTRALHSHSMVFTHNLFLCRASSIAPFSLFAHSCTVPLLCH
jgi:hypothetical protein